MTVAPRGTTAVTESRLIQAGSAAREADLEAEVAEDRGRETGFLPGIRMGPGRERVYLLRARLLVDILTPS
jgi:hypothetical protein